MTRGFHQSWLTATAIDPIAFPGIEFLDYPKPVAWNLSFEFKGIDAANLDFRLFDLSGKLLLEKQVSTQPEHINMGNYPSGA